MPLLDHFRRLRGPVDWFSLHTTWACELVRHMNESVLGEEFVALPKIVRVERKDLDVTSFEPPRADVSVSVPLTFPERADVEVVWQPVGGVVAAILLPGPHAGNGSVTQDMFVGKCLDYLGYGVCVVLVDVVTTATINLHDEIMRKLAPATPDSAGRTMGVTTYRPTARGREGLVEIWHQPCAVGQPLPTMPLRLTGDTFVPVEFEMTYTQACRYLRLVG